MHLELTDEEAAALTQELHDIVENDRLPVLAAHPHAEGHTRPAQTGSGAQPLAPNEGLCSAEKWQIQAATARLGEINVENIAGIMQMDDFISEDDLLTFEGFLKYQGVPATATPEELKMFRGFFDEATLLHKTGPKVGLMKLQPVPGEQKYAVAIRDGSKLWLTLWVRCSRKGEIFVMYPRPDRDWDAHASYHLKGTFHQKKLWPRGHLREAPAVDGSFQRERAPWIV
jgi:hypothetical protein